LEKLQTDLKEFISLLSSHKVEYVIVGGHAVAYHGYPRFTGDIDFFIRPTPPNAQRVLDVLEAFGFGGLQIGISDLTAPDKILQLGRPPNRIDILTSISGVDFEVAWASRVHATLDGEAVAFLALDEVIRNKQASNREKDRADVAKLLAIAGRGDAR
jgi:predicted nucleotidyltransferase